jgi:hypothetical protein
MFPRHIVGMELILNCLPDDCVNLVGFSGEDSGVFQRDMMFLNEHVFCHCQIVS